MTEEKSNGEESNRLKKIKDIWNTIKRSQYALNNGLFELMDKIGDINLEFGESNIILNVPTFLTIKEFSKLHQFIIHYFRYKIENESVYIQSSIQIW